MRASEFIRESTFPDNVKHYPSMPGNNSYKSYRFGMALAGASTYRDTFSGQDSVTIAFTDADRNIVNAAEKATKVKGQSAPVSKKELTNNVSPVSSNKRNKYGV
jgi:hypothetical protein